MNEWMPIETAPIGERVLVYVPGDRKGVRIGTASDGMPYPNQHGVAWRGSLLRFEKEPTHWMPLPDSPALSGKVSTLPDWGTDLECAWCHSPTKHRYHWAATKTEYAACSVCCLELIADAPRGPFISWARQHDPETNLTVTVAEHVDGRISVAWGKDRPEWAYFKRGTDIMRYARELMVKRLAGTFRATRLSPVAEAGFGSLPEAK